MTALVTQRVAVAVAADPRSEPDEGRHLRRSRARAISGQRRLRPSVDLRHHCKEHVVEGRHRGAYLVQRPGALGPQLGRPPQHVDLLEQTPAYLRLLRGAQPGVVAAVQQLGDAPDAGGDRPPTCLGGVRSENGSELQTRQQPLGLGAAVQPRHLLDRRGDRAGQWPVGLVGRTQRADPVVFLGDIDKVEVDGERAGDILGPLDPPGRDQLLGLRRGILRHRFVLVVGRDRQFAQPLDVGQQPCAAVLTKDLAEGVAEQADVGAQRFGHVEARSLTGSRGGGRHAARVVV